MAFFFAFMLVSLIGLALWWFDGPKAPLPDRVPAAHAPAEGVTMPAKMGAPNELPKKKIDAVGALIIEGQELQRRGDSSHKPRPNQ